MKERPILFSAPMVKAILEGRKTQTRRIVKGDSKLLDALLPNYGLRCRHGQPGDRLWVRETWRPCAVPQHGDSQCVEYRASDYCKAGHLATLNRTNWRPSIFMPRWASRITLEITDVRVERLQDISDSDAVNEGITGVLDDGIWSYNGHALPRDGFTDLWKKINGDGSWDTNPWVWVVSFKVVR